MHNAGLYSQIHKVEQAKHKWDSQTKSYLERTNLKNPYINSNIVFPNGEKMYVTNKGVAKWYPSKDIFTATSGSNSCPTKLIRVSVPWKPAYRTPGATINTTPNLKTGTPMTKGQSCGYEGTNIFTASLYSQQNTTNTQEYMGCYQDESESPAMKFVENAPISETEIQNQYFAQPEINHNSYRALNQIPYWNGDFILVNNSTAYPFPMPYPAGNQTVALNNTQKIFQIINLTKNIEYVITFYCVGKKDSSNNIQLSINDKVIYTITPPSQTWNTYTTTFHVDETKKYTIMFSGTLTSSSTYKTSAIQSVLLTHSSDSVINDGFTLDTCRSYAINNGYSYYAIQNANTTTQKGYCAVSNDYPTTTKYGKSIVLDKEIQLWSSNIVSTGAISYIGELTSSGALTIFDNDNKNVFSTNNTKANPTNYLGCFTDKTTTPTMKAITGTFTLSQAMDYAKQNAYSFFGLKSPSSLVVSNDFAEASKFGVASNCQAIDTNNNFAGSDYANAIYATNADPSKYVANFILIVQDTGNVEIYRGEQVNDTLNPANLIWSSETTGKQKQAYPPFSSTHSKYGKNWITVGNTLLPNEYVSSPSGNVMLKMQPDGNLVIVTFETHENCTKTTDNNYLGGESANAVYKNDTEVSPSDLQKMAYIDQNTFLHQYDNTESILTDSYTFLKNTISNAQALTNGTTSGNTSTQCKKACNANTQCYGYSFDESNSKKICSLYGNDIATSTKPQDQTSLYIRNQKPKHTPPFVPDTTTAVSTSQYSHYPKGKDINNGKEGFDSMFIPNNSGLWKQEKKLKHIAEEVNKNIQKQKIDIQSNNELSDQYATFIKNYEATMKEMNQQFPNDKSVHQMVNESSLLVSEKYMEYIVFACFSLTTVFIVARLANK